MLNSDKKTNEKERGYLYKKWSNLETSLREYLRYSPLKRRKAVTFTFVCEKIYVSKKLRPFVERNQKVALKFYDWCLDQALVFKDKDYSHLKDFFLPQKYPDEVLTSLK